MTDQLINVGIAIDPSGAVTGVTVGEQAFNRLGKSADEMNKKIDASEASWQRMRNAALAFASVATVRMFLTGMTTELMQAEQATARFDAVLRATGNTARISRGQVADLANEIANTTLFSDDDVVAASARMMTFRSVQGDTFREGIRLAADLAAMLGSDMVSATSMLGKALESPADGLLALRRAGVVLSDQAKDNIKHLVEVGRTADAQRAILAELQARIGGVARAMNTGLTREIEGAGKAWREFLENVGRDESSKLGWVGTFFRGLKITLQDLTPVTDPLALRTREFMEAADKLTQAQDRLARLQAQTQEGGGGLFKRQLAADDPNIVAAQATVDRLQRQADALNTQITNLRQQRDAITSHNDQTFVPGVSAQDPEVKKKIDETTAALQRQLDTMGMTNAQIARYDALLLGATPAQAATIMNMTRQADIAQVMADAYEALNTGVETNTEDLWRQAVAAGATTEEMNDLLDVLDQLTAASEDARKAGDELRRSAPKPPERKDPSSLLRDADRQQERWERLTQQSNRMATDSANFWQNAWTRAAENTQDILANFIETATSDAELRFSTFMENILRMINRIAAQMAAAGLIKMFVAATDGIPNAPRVPTGRDVSRALEGVPNVSIGSPPPNSTTSPAMARSRELAAVGATEETPSGVTVHQSINFNISAIDMQDMEQALMRQKGTIARAVAESVQQSTGFAAQLQGRKR